jgi:CheY-like chemotaxis protein
VLPVIADIKMPEMDGITFLTLLRNQHPDLPVLALSGYVGSEEILSYTFDGFIAKPLKLEEVRKIVEETLVGNA